jgi:hypothetical protein
MDLIFRTLEQQKGAKISKPSTNNSKRHPAQFTRLPCLGYADDVIIFANSSTDAQAQLHHLEKTAALFGLFINTGAGKTEAMYLGRFPSTDNKRIFTLNGREVPHCEEYKYLGAVLGGDWKTDFKRRKALSWTLLRKYERIWKGSRFGTQAKAHLFYALVVPTLTYSVCTYPWSPEVKDRLNEAFHHMLRYALNEPVDWEYFTHRPVEQLLGHHMFLTATIVYNRLREHGHWIRQHYRKDNAIQHPLLDLLRWDHRNEMTFHGGKHAYDIYQLPRRRLGPADGLLEMTGLPTYADLTERALDKYRWRQLVESATMKEQLHVASQISHRRFKEPRRWLFGDHTALIRAAKETARTKFAATQRK